MGLPKEKRHPKPFVCQESGERPQNERKHQQRDEQQDRRHGAVQALLPKTRGKGLNFPIESGAFEPGRPINSQQRTSEDLPGGYPYGGNLQAA